MSTLPAPTPVLDEGTPTTVAKTVKAPRRPLYTLVGFVILAFMLFPLYWMINVSLQPAGNAVATLIIGNWVKEVDRPQVGRVFSGEDPFDDLDMLDEHSAEEHRADVQAYKHKESTVVAH